MRISIVMTYYSRQEQLLKTLESFKEYNPSDFNVIIVDDDSPEDIILQKYDFDIELLKCKNKIWHNAGIPFNWGFNSAMKYSPDIVIIQNAECLHNGDILSEAKKVTEENYLSFACYSLAKGEGPNCELQNKIATYDHESAWYNHSVYRPIGFHFCCAITTNNLKKINGFDERFWDGVAYDDNMLVHQIKNLGLRIDFIDFPFVFHQWHEKAYEITADRVDKNCALFTELRDNTEYRAVHLITPDL